MPDLYITVICTRQAKVTIKPMIITKCTRACHPKCVKNNGCDLTLPPNNPDYDKTQPLSQCQTLPIQKNFTTAYIGVLSVLWLENNARRRAMFPRRVLLNALIKIKPIALDWQLYHGVFQFRQYLIHIA